MVICVNLRERTVKLALGTDRHLNGNTRLNLLKID